MVQAIGKSLDKPVYNAVNIDIKKPEVNAKENGKMSVTNDNGIYNAVKITIDRPSVNTEPKKVYDYPEAEDVVTYENANIQPLALPEGLPAGNAYEKISAKENISVPEPNYTTTEAEKGENSAENKEVTFNGTEKKPEITPSEPIKPEVDIAYTISALSGNDYDKQAMAIADIALLSEKKPEEAKPYIVREVFNALIDIVKNLEKPSEKQNEIRQKIIANIIAAQKKQPIPYQITKEEQAIATNLAPIEMAERNKEYALIAISSLAKNYINQVKKENGNTVPFTDIPGIAEITNTIRDSKNPEIRIAAIEALGNLYKPEYKEEITTILNLAQQDKHPLVSKIAAMTLQKLA